jgi:hypothetical protein
MDPNVKMGDKERLQLNNMLKENDVLDQTSLIRKLKHSVIFKKEVATLLNLKKKYPSEPEALNAEAMIECSFLFSYYTDLYNKIRKDEIDIKILYQFIDVLANIEEGKIDQHEGSFMVGTLLKKIYVDSALRKADMINQAHEEEAEEPEPVVEPIPISWKEFKNARNQ